MLLYVHWCYSHCVFPFCPGFSYSFSSPGFRGKDLPLMLCVVYAF